MKGLLSLLVIYSIAWMYIYIYTYIRSLSIALVAISDVAFGKKSS